MTLVVRFCLWGHSRRQDGEGGGHGGAPRILYVITSFDRGRRLGPQFRRVIDKLDYVLMIADEMREACEVQ